MTTSPTTTFTVGQGIETRAEFDALPIGTVIEPRDGGRWYEKTGDSGGANYDWVDEDGDVYSSGNFSLDGYNVISSLPGGTSAESLRSFQRRFRERVLLAQRTNGVSIDPINKAFRELGIADLSNFTVGEQVSRDARGSLPPGSLAQCGDEANWSAFGLFQVNDHQTWTHVTGGRQRPLTMLTLLRVGQDQYDPSEDPPSTPEELHAWKVRAYHLSRRVKNEQSYCGVLDNTMRSLGITEDLIRQTMPMVSAPVLSVYGARRLPPGSVLEWRHSRDPQQVQWFIRDEAATNTAGTRRVLARRNDGGPLRNSMTAMRVMHNPNTGAPMNIQVSRDEFWDLMPPGTTFAINSNVENATYTMCEDRTATVTSYQQTSGGYSIDSFSTYRNLWIRSLP